MRGAQFSGFCRTVPRLLMATSARLLEGDMLEHWGVGSSRQELEDSAAPVLAAKQCPGLHPKGLGIKYTFLN